MPLFFWLRGDFILESSSVVQSLGLSEKQQELLSVFSALLDKHSIKLAIDLYPSLFVNPISLDVEHDEQGNIVCIGVWANGQAYCYTNITPLLIELLKDCQIIAHNGISDFDCLQSWGINVRDEQLVHDTMLMAHILDSSRKQYGLKKLAKEDLGIEYPSYDDIVGKRTLKQSKPRLTLDKQPIELVAMYNAMDCYATYSLYKHQGRQLDVSKPLEDQKYTYFTELEKPCATIFNQMETRGISVDLKYLEGLKITLEAQKGPLAASIKAQLGQINLNSPKQLLEALHAKNIRPCLKGKPSTDKRALAAESQEPVVESLLKFSEIETLLTSFVLPYLERNQTVVHPRFNQCGTRTGRPSCSDPNLLQIPRRTENGQLVRRMFTARQGMLMGDCDYGQIEPRVLAHLSEDPNLCELFNNEVDFHSYTAERLGISRERAKVLNLSVGYRATFKSVAQQLKCSDREAQNEIDKWWGLFPNLRRWQDQLLFTARKSGVCTTLYGRKIKVDGLSNGNRWKREAAERQAINNITQGSAAEIMKMAMINITKDCPNIGLLCQVYDELLFEAPEPIAQKTLAYVVDKMRDSIKLKVPLTVDGGLGNNWSEAKK